MHHLLLSTGYLQRSRRAFVPVALGLVMAGCGASDSSPGAIPPDTDAGRAACLPGETPLDDGRCQPAGLPLDMPCPPGEMPLDDGRCQPAGLPLDMPCPPGEAPLDDGRCQPAGVPPEACGQGFEPDGRGGCNAALPEDPCPPGQMAIPGEIECHDVAPCGEGDYGTIPVDATTQFVDGSYPGEDSDGTRARPWKRIQDGIDHARAGAIVALAAGSYAEALAIDARPVRLWGRCPALVEVVGAEDAVAALQVLGEQASRSEIRGLAISGPGIGVVTSGAGEVVLAHAWIHDTADMGIVLEGSLGPSSMTVSGSLIEATADVGIAAAGADLTVEATVVRDGRPRGNGVTGRGIHVQYDELTRTRSTLALRTSLVERNRGFGVSVIGSDAIIDAIAVRDTMPAIDGNSGVGAFISNDPGTHERSTTTLSGSVVERNHLFGVGVFGSDATIEAVVVRDTHEWVRGGTAGNGVVIIADADMHERANVTLRASLLERNHDTGMTVEGSDATIAATIVRDSLPSIKESNLGRGILIKQGVGTDLDPSRVAILTSLVEHNQDIGVHVAGSVTTIEATVVRDTLPTDGARGGVGIEVSNPDDARERASLALSSSLVERNHEIGIRVSGADAAIESTVVRDTQRNSDGTSGRGIQVQESLDDHEPAKATIRNSLVERNHDGGVVVGGADVTIEASVVRDTQLSTGDDPTGFGVGVQPMTARANVTLRTSVLERNHHAAASVIGSDVSIESTILRDTRSLDDGTLGRGVNITNSSDPHARANVTLRTSLVERNHDVGVFVSGSDATIDATVIRATQRGAAGSEGRGISIQDHPEEHERANVTLRASRVEQNHDIGVFVFDSDATIEQVIVRETASRLDGTGGDGIVVESAGAPAAVAITATTVESNARAGIANFAAGVVLVSSTIRCNKLDLNGRASLDGKRSFSFDGSKNNRCGCEELASPCPVETAELTPPGPVPAGRPPP
ncbi:right-handed parallel beta-helix repeat-containing protein [Sorangium sp. So ce854]|uniref:right-handed parallel beta-helix repeat-containing protein n=1 Tax=Sorangium sp. So ce854 TaxID=3133322 RepID=UPI003F6048FB